MSSPWGPALDAEINYRHQQARADFRPMTRLRKLEQEAPTRRLPADLSTTGWIVDQPQPSSPSHIPVQQTLVGADDAAAPSPARVA